MTKIPVNGYGRLGKLAMMASMWPCMTTEERRALTRAMNEKELRGLDEIDRRNGLDRDAQAYALIRKPDNSLLFHLTESAVTDVRFDGEMPKERYHDRTFPKDYYKRKKAKRRQQKQSRKRSRK